ncbi:hypothetical protein GCM10023212_07100 [Luteolibacter yonseiensis]
MKALGINSFQLTWKDNSTNELGWEILAAVGKTTPKRYRMYVKPNATSLVLVTNELAGKTLSFQIRAYNGATALEKFSKPTAIVSATALKSKTTGAPTNLVVKSIEDGSVHLGWKDNSTAEAGYVIEYKETSAKKWTAMSADPGIQFNVPVPKLEPTKKYSFRVRGAVGNPLKYTAYTNQVSATTVAFQAPTGLVVQPVAEGEFSFKWKDNTTAEAGYELQYKGPDDTKFTPLDPYSSDTTSIPSVPGATPNGTYQFQLRAFRFVGSTKTYTGFTPVVSAKANPLIAPTDLVSSLPTDTSVTLTWKSASKVATGYQIQYREVGATDFKSVSTGKVLTYKVDKLVSGKTYEFKVRSNVGEEYSTFTGTAQGLTKHGFISELNPPILTGNQFLYSIQTSFPTGITNMTVTGLPAGLVYNSTSRTISGKLTTAGTYTVTLKVTFSDGTVSTRSLVLTSVGTKPIILPPHITVVSVPLTKPQTVPLTGRFADLDTHEAVRVTTTKGVFDVILYPDSTPKTVENFFKYVDAKSYENSFIHRSPANFVVQGGGYTHTTADGFKSIPTFGTVVNEPGLSNVRGTIAMAKVGGQPNSATSQFFVNVVDSLGLDSDNGGFTVFGRVPSSGMTVVDNINDLPTADYNITVGANVVPLTDLPVDAPTAPAVLDPAQLVKITSVVDAPILTYSVLPQDSSIATAVLDGTNVVITAVSKGSTTIQVTATDLDGLSVSQYIPVTVP